MSENQLTRDTLIGFAVGDALGVPVEFLTREEVRRIGLKDMVGSENDLPFESRWGHLIPSGCFSDDTSMLIAGMDSIIKNDGLINFDDVMSRFMAWLYQGIYSPVGRAFDLGRVTAQALRRYTQGCPPLECGGKDEMDNGNGSLMRILPFSLFAIKNQFPTAETAKLIGEASSLTHAHEISKLGCFLYTEFLRELVVSADPAKAFEKLISGNYSMFSEDAVKAYSQLFDPELASIPDSQIEENNGYVVTTLVSAIYSILTTDSFESAVLKAIGLGYDTDTVGAVTGSLAGAIYGYDAIPKRWLDKLRLRRELESLAEDFDYKF